MGFSADWGKERATAWGRCANAVARSLPQIPCPRSPVPEPRLVLGPCTPSRQRRFPIGPNLVPTGTKGLRAYDGSHLYRAGSEMALGQQSNRPVGKRREAT